MHRIASFFAGIGGICYGFKQSGFNVVYANEYDKNACKTIEAELDLRFVDVEIHRETSFDGWLTLRSIGNKKKIVVPLRLHKHINKLLKEGVMSGGVRLGLRSISVSFELEPPVKAEGKTVGIDVGMNRAFSCSDGTDPGEWCNGHTMKSVCERVARRKRGSNGHERACRHRKNLIGYFKNRLDWSSILRIRIEKIRHLRTRRRSRDTSTPSSTVNSLVRCGTRPNDGASSFLDVVPVVQKLPNSCFS